MNNAQVTIECQKKRMTVDVNQMKNQLKIPSIAADGFDEPTEILGPIEANQQGDGQVQQHQVQRGLKRDNSVHMSWLPFRKERQNTRVH